MRRNMQITLNGEKIGFQQDSISVEKMLESLNISKTGVAIELNRFIVRSENWPTVMLKNGDTVEVVSFVGGG